ncbi:Hypothetical Protein NG00_00259 [Corynebacterium camporealensis]|uniref:Uncharacterized protein n=1 Tax=Corynebacterium camporealensis TaxID=161896 RepID=A0A0F6QWU2_9CORY|nr:DIP1984 family protein [Corynebacterium camporealensis]AKE38283.1 hypothetical protein UL81_01490 [Corynebacterium camporealensis]AVH87588.1 Hypothetical Protein NG00_00259 [Corynebacterium camporealensis]
MLLAEALAERAAAQQRLQTLRERLLNTLRIQEGDTPEEDPEAMLREVENIGKRLDYLVQAINRTNMATPFDEGTLSDALALRDGYKRNRRLWAEFAEKASARQERWTRSEVKFISTYSVKKLRKHADDCAQQFRELDTRIQQANWSTELIEK